MQSGLNTVAANVLQVLACKVPGIRKQYLDSLFTLLCNTHAACNWPLPSRPEFEKAVLNNVLDRLAVRLPLCSGHVQPDALH